MGFEVSFFTIGEKCMFTKMRTYISDFLEKRADYRALSLHLQTQQRRRPIVQTERSSSSKLDFLQRRSIRQERFTQMGKLFRNHKNEHQLPARTMIMVVNNLGCLPFTLSALSNHRHQDVRIAIAENPMTPDSVMTRLAFDEHPDVRFAVAGSYNTTETVLSFLINDENPYVANRAQTTLDHINGIAPAKESASKQDTAESSIRVRRVLVVEDNPTLRDVTLRQLKILGFDASASENGKDALVRLSQEKFGLVLMDCLMPVMDGFEATMALRNTEAGTLCHIPVIALTARVMAGDKERCLASGMDGYLEKPVALDELRKILAYWFDQDADEKAYKEEIRNSVSNLIDLDKLEEIHGNQPLDQLVDMLNKGVREIVSRLSDSIYENNRADLPRLAHELKGYAGVMACKSMEDASLSLEIAALKQDEAAIMRGYRTILELVEKLEKKVASVLA
jgi:CheY-like chemotaxis protein